MYQWPSFVIGELEFPHPIIQGGMGVGISLHRLSSAVSKAGGLGVIAAAAIGLEIRKELKNLKEADKIVLEREIRKAKELAGGKPIGVNIMVAVTDYEEKVKVAVEAGADVIISGAGLPFSLPEVTEGKNVCLLPIVSSARAAEIILKRWWSRSKRLPDAFVIEGPLAGGHLGFKEDELKKGDAPHLYKILDDVLYVTDKWRIKTGFKIPVIVAGGIFRGWEVKEALSRGASGVQMATRFVATYECDADYAFKEMYIKAKKEDIVIIKSPVGMPARALKNAFVESMMRGEKRPVKCPYHCLKPCNPKKVPYCIAEALIRAKEGDVDDGLIFCGARVYEVDKILSVNELFDEIHTEYVKGKA